MFPEYFANGPGEPIAWWLFWFAVSLLIYTFLTVWFYRVGKRETRQPDPGKATLGNKPGAGGKEPPVEH